MTAGTKRFAIVFALIAVATVAWIGYRAYDLYFEPVLLETGVVQFPSDGNRQTLLDTLLSKQMIADSVKLRDALQRLDFSYRSGQFELQKDWTAKELVDYLERGRQKEARIILTGGRMLSDMAAKATRFVEVDSAALMTAILDTTWLAANGLSAQTAMSMAIPNTYNVYWNATPEELRDRLKKESDKFWEKDGRQEKADSLGLTRLEVYTLASIVDAETNNSAEMPTIAGAYLNRIRRGIKLDADPTVVFAMGDFTLKRVLYEHLTYVSPYNTYLNVGIPPGPIMMAGIDAIDAVLNPETHDYIFFVTKGDGSGTHSFARDMTGHSRNIRVFQENLRKRGIKR